MRYLKQNTKIYPIKINFERLKDVEYAGVLQPSDLFCFGALVGDHPNFIDENRVVVFKLGDFKIRLSLDWAMRSMYDYIMDVPVDDDVEVLYMGLLAENNKTEWVIDRNIKQFKK